MKRILRKGEVIAYQNQNAGEECEREKGMSRFTQTSKEQRRRQSERVGGNEKANRL